MVHGHGHTACSSQNCTLHTWSRYRHRNYYRCDRVLGGITRLGGLSLRPRAPFCKKKGIYDLKTRADEAPEPWSTIHLGQGKACNVKATTRVPFCHRPKLIGHGSRTTSFKGGSSAAHTTLHYYSLTGLKDTYTSTRCHVPSCTKSDLQGIISCFEGAAQLFVLEISLTKTDVLHQPLQHEDHRATHITIGKPDTCNWNIHATIDREINHKLAKASSAFGGSASEFGTTSICSR